MGFILSEDVVPPYRNIDKWDSMMRNEFYLNFELARGSEQEIVTRPPFKPYNRESFFKINDPLWKFNHWKNAGGDSEYENIRGRRRACRDKGLTGAEKRACARRLRQMGWRKGDPIPADITVGDEDVSQAEKDIRAGIPESGRKPMSAAAKAFIALAAFTVTGLVIWGIARAVKRPARIAAAPAPVSTAKVRPSIKVGK